MNNVILENIKINSIIAARQAIDEATYGWTEYTHKDSDVRTALRAARQLVARALARAEAK